MPLQGKGSGGEDVVALPGVAVGEEPAKAFSVDGVGIGAAFHKESEEGPGKIAHSDEDRPGEGVQDYF